MSVLNDRVEELSKYVVRLLITGNTPDRVNEGMTGIVNSRLNDVIQCYSIRRYFVAESVVHVFCQTVCHPVFVLCEVWEVIKGSEARIRRYLVRCSHFDNTDNTDNTSMRFATGFCISIRSSWQGVYQQTCFQLPRSDNDA